MAESVIEVKAKDLKKDNVFYLGGAKCKVISVIPRIGQPGAVMVRFKLKSDVSRDFYSMWINEVFVFQVHTNL